MLIRMQEKGTLIIVDGTVTWCNHGNQYGGSLRN
jgi:hypothetical protein